MPHPPEKVWRALIDPALLVNWLLPVSDLKLECGAAFTFKTAPVGSWDGTVHCRISEIDPPRKLGYRCKMMGGKPVDLLARIA